MCPPSRFPYIAVRFGAARRKWMDYGEGEAVTEARLGMRTITLAADRIRADKDAQGVCRGFSAAVFAAVLTVARLLSVSGGV